MMISACRRIVGEESISRPVSSRFALPCPDSRRSTTLFGGVQTPLALFEQNQQAGVLCPQQPAGKTAGA